MSSASLPIRFQSEESKRCQVLVIGAGLAGVSAALLIKKRLPRANVVVVDRVPQLPEVGHSQALTGPAGVFFQMALHAAGCLAREHLPRHGEHFWFFRKSSDPFGDLTEIGADEFASHPGQHVDTARLAHSFYRTAELAGVRFVLGTEVSHVRIDWPASTAYLKHSEGTTAMQARWIVDASGPSGLLSKQFELRQPMDTPEHTKIVANWSQCTSFDELASVLGLEGSGVLEPFTRSRELATHNFFGSDWRVSVFPNVSGGSSVQLEMDRERYEELRGLDSDRSAYSTFLRGQPGLRDLLRHAELEPESFHIQHKSDWRPTRSCDRGWVLVGDAAGSLATLFAAPLDTMARTLWNAAEIISLDLGPAGSEAQVVEQLRLHNLRERQHDDSDEVVLHTTTRALCGDAALFSVAFSFRRSLRSLELARMGRELKYFTSLSWHTLWQRKVRTSVFGRLKKLAADRQAAGHYGQDNTGWQLRLGPGEGTFRPLLAAAAQWIRLEYEGLRVGMSPVPGDRITPDAPEIAKRLALLHRVEGSTTSPPAISE
jgi:2-polyprenyl-6-methoxyphenol hydroxylase-like FAD-dependent oxidoreductase